jgi:Cd2+/Zn2+-exporting ATPase
LVAALVFATGAEVLSFFAPDQMAWKVAGMAIAALAIWLSASTPTRKALRAAARRS